MDSLIAAVPGPEDTGGGGPSLLEIAIVIGLYLVLFLVALPVVVFVRWREQDWRESVVAGITRVPKSSSRLRDHLRAAISW